MGECVQGPFRFFFFQIILHVKRGVVSRRFENVQYSGSRQRCIATERFRSLPLTKVVRAYNKLGAISWRTAFGPKSNFYMGLRDIPVPPGGRRCGNNGANHGPMELTAIVIPRSRRSRYTHIQYIYVVVILQKMEAKRTKSLYHKWHRTRRISALHSCGAIPLAQMNWGNWGYTVL